MRSFLLNRSIKKHASPGQYVGWKRVQSIFILFDEHEGEHRPEIDELQQVLENEGKSVGLLKFASAKKPKENVPAATYFKADLNLTKKPKKHVAEMVPKSADVLIDWTKMPESPNDFLATDCNAGIKLGIDRSLPCFDITVSGQAFMPGKVIEEILKYLKLINQ